MTESLVLPQIKAIIAEVNQKRAALADYKIKLDAAEQELEDAKIAREQNFSFETDKVVVEKEGFVNRIKRRYLEETQSFENNLPKKVKLVEELFDKYVREMWVKDPSVQELETQVINSFKQTVELLNQYQEKPGLLKASLLPNVVDADFKNAFKGQMSFIGVNTYILANKVPIGYNTYQELYNAGRQLGVNFE
ncbi:hypothetical protein ACRPLZ_03650 [Streptococcus uberis]|uniref:hypothetical protein n=1 Tax=Streptococcus uberis TaxID=1349 RepID=UPI0006203E2E|nr:hypothetical protein [Streptococcus uberis]KKF60428.1 hypothetical protein AF68_03515 [Streptococcus uberis B362]QBX12002.1 hypothetical protein JavanS624_0010 [Streptococcus satellite phage Javan624]